MNVFFEFHRILRELQRVKTPYALIGGVAMAYYADARFTKDIDLLVKPEDFEAIKAILGPLNYRETASPWRFASGMILHRFLKVEDGDEMLVDVLVADTEEHRAVVDRARIAGSEKLGEVRVASRADMIWLKEQRKSPIDQQDLQKLREGSDVPN